jgi:hypothetical protein
MQHRELQPDEMDLVGEWLATGKGVEADAVCSRIEWLVEHGLTQLGTDTSGWDTLYRDPRDGRLWELTHPRSEMHGGGPPRLTLIAPDVAATKYTSVLKDDEQGS